MKKHVLVEKNILAIAVMLVGIALIAYGISTGQVTAVLNKAIRVCMECIGIG
ncbi:MAG: thioredoxin [Clostridiales bacterium]|nr:thioredoxin [Clostridiales bacterium]MBR4818435.1 thioredoxin [Clostridiales bacterium]MBR5040117.1 thioredoxin [Clostridiales bacterium]MBR5059124.1 thioredoxin [Clostridiales bacterium]